MPNPHAPDVTVILPCRNEADCIAGVIDQPRPGYGHAARAGVLCTDTPTMSGSVAGTAHATLDILWCAR